MQRIVAYEVLSNHPSRRLAMKTPLALAAAWSLLIACAVALAPSLARSAPPAAEPPGLPLLLIEDFEKGAANWQPTDPQAWKLLDTPRGKVYSLFQQSKYQP